MIHTSTGNQLDFVSEIENGKEVLIGLFDRTTNKTRYINDPEGFLAVAQDFITKYKEQKKVSKKKTAKKS